MQNLAAQAIQNVNADEPCNLINNDPLVSFLTEVPPSLNEAMTSFIEDHPNWDQYRLIQAALSGFLIQNGVDSRPINRIYFQNMFSKKSFEKKL